jgi:1-acyl-sn-glycerol-3-phosphate acyltransferase
MSDSRRYVPRNPRAFNRLVKIFYGAWLRLVYRIESHGEELLEDLKPPYVLVANHVSTRDPFIISSFSSAPIYWVTSDGNMRTRFMRFFLGLVGSIPKAKAIPDIQTVNWIVEVVRKRKGVVGIFPEGQASWDGHTLPLFRSTAKLLKLLKVPVVAVRLEGAYFALPRWTWERRRGKVTIEWALLFSAEDLRSLGADEIFRRLESGLAHDEYGYQSRVHIAYRSRRRAEHVELALYLCPECETIGRLHSSGSRLHCSACGSTFVLDRYGYFSEAGRDRAPFATIRDWDQWQAETFAAEAEKARGSPGRPFIADGGAMLFRGRRMNPLRRIRTGTLVLYPDRLELATLSGERLRFSLAEVDGIGVLKRNLLEFYVGRDLYQVRFVLRSVSARKWAEGLEFFRKALLKG